MERTSIVIPNWNGMRWLEGVLGSVAEQSAAPAAVIVVDNGSSDGSASYLRSSWPDVEVVEWTGNRGFAAAANCGIELAKTEFVALVNTDVILRPDWLERAEGALAADPRAASVATKMVDLDDPGRIYDAGDFLRRDGACEQRGRFRPDGERFDSPCSVWSACAGAAVYRREAVLAVGGFDERFFTYLEDVELGLRLRLAGWECIYEPCVALHAGGGSESALAGGAARWVERNTLLLIARHFPPAWIGPVIYRQAAWKLSAIRSGNLGPFLRGFLSGLRMAPSMLRSRFAAERPKVAIRAAVPARPWRGPSAGGHPLSPE